MTTYRSIRLAVIGDGARADALRRAATRHQHVSLVAETESPAVVCLAGDGDQSEAIAAWLGRDITVMCPRVASVGAWTSRPGAAQVAARLLVAPEFRCVAPFVAAREQYRAGAIGDLVAIRLNQQAPADGKNALATLGPDAIDYVRWCTGVEIARSHATIGRFNADGDMATLTLRLTNGVIATIELERVLPTGFPREGELQLELHGMHGSIHVTPNHQQVTVFGENDHAPTWDGWVAPAASHQIETVVGRLMRDAPPPTDLADWQAAHLLVTAQYANT